MEAVQTSYCCVVDEERLELIKGILNKLNKDFDVIDEDLGKLKPTLHL